MPSCPISFPEGQHRPANRMLARYIPRLVLCKIKFSASKGTPRRGGCRSQLCYSYTVHLLLFYINVLCRGTFCLYVCVSVYKTPANGNRYVREYLYMEWLIMITCRVWCVAASSCSCWGGRTWPRSASSGWASGASSGTSPPAWAAPRRRWTRPASGQPHLSISVKNIPEN